VYIVTAAGAGGLIVSLTSEFLLLRRVRHAQSYPPMFGQKIEVPGKKFLVTMVTMFA
jgi:hypothetical protein